MKRHLGALEEDQFRVDWLTLINHEQGLAVLCLSWLYQMYGIRELAAKRVLSQHHRMLVEQKIYPFEVLHIPSQYGKHIPGDQLAHLQSLKELRLKRNPSVTDAHLVCLTQLRSLDISFNTLITNDAVSRLTSLFSLILDANDCIGDAALAPLTQLITLNLAGNDTITGAGLRVLPDLGALVLDDNDTITDSDVSLLTTLVVLSLRGNQVITDAGLRALPSIRNLCLDDTPQVTGESLDHMQLCALVLNVDSSEIEPESLSLQTDLVFLSLTNNYIIEGDSLNTLSNLTALVLRDDFCITDAALRSMTNLTRLSLHGESKLTAAGLTTLTRLTHLDLFKDDENIMPIDLTCLSSLTSIMLYDHTLYYPHAIEFKKSVAIEIALSECRCGTCVSQFREQNNGVPSGLPREQGEDTG